VTTAGRVVFSLRYVCSARIFFAHHHLGLIYRLTFLIFGSVRWAEGAIIQHSLEPAPAGSHRQISLITPTAAPYWRTTKALSDVF
jgi:hypothetical protein